MDHAKNTKMSFTELTPGIFGEFSGLRKPTKESKNFRVLTFSRGDPEDFSLKGYDIAVKAIVELNDSSYRLLFVGAPDGGRRRELTTMWNL